VDFEMRVYSPDRVEAVLADIAAKKKVVENKLEELKAKREGLGFLQRKEKRELDEQIEETRLISLYYNFASLMFGLYSDSFSHDPQSGLSDRQLIEIENEAREGDGISKLIAFCQRCFIDEAMTERDFARLELEAAQGDHYSACILWCYRDYFQ